MPFLEQTEITGSKAVQEALMRIAGRFAVSPTRVVPEDLTQIWQRLRESGVDPNQWKLEIGFTDGSEGTAVQVMLVPKQTGEPIK